MGPDNREYNRRIYGTDPEISRRRQLRARAVPARPVQISLTVLMFLEGSFPREKHTARPCLPHRLPFFVSLCSLAVPLGRLRRMVFSIANVLIAGGAVLLFLEAGPDPLFFAIDQPVIGRLLTGAEFAFGLLVAYLGFTGKRYLISALGGVMACLTVVFEAALPVAGAFRGSRQLFADKFSVMMALLVGILGALIVSYAIGYMARHHADHPEAKDRRRIFGFFLYLFISAMFGLVFSNDLRWMLFFWEVTTLCSFFLIGYNGDAESDDAAFRALWMNLLGGLAFSVAIFYLGRMGITELDRMILARSAAPILLPAVFLSFAGIVKSAQMPFSPWLTAAMVAPTPVSALLHSSTMVKAGVYLLLRVSPVLNNTPAGVSLTFIGGVTFLFASLIAVSQSDAKRVLAYSTISTLGLIVMCAGVGTYEAAWSALLLIIFHAVAKSLLFLCVGVVEQRTGSRDIEDMGSLITKMPKVAVMMNIGLAGMFLAPFGVVISKAVTLKALVDTHPLLGVILAFGSGATLFFYAKWMGKLIMVRTRSENREGSVGIWEWAAMAALSGLTIATCLLFPAITDVLIDPYIVTAYGTGTTVEPFNLYMIVGIMAEPADHLPPRSLLPDLA